MFRKLFDARCWPLLLAAGACACSQPASPPQHKAQPKPPVAAAPAPTTPPSSSEPASAAPGDAAAQEDRGPPLPPEREAAAQAIQQAAPPATGAKAAKASPTSTAAYDAVLLRTQVLLDRAGFSTGVIDGKDGENLAHALAAYAQAQGLTQPQGKGVDPALFAALAQADSLPVVKAYRITGADVAGPFIGDPPKDYAKLAELAALSYSDPEQLLAEKFHMDRGLLKALNPGVDLAQAGAVILVAVPRDGPRPLKVVRIEVDKSQEAVRAYGEDGRLAAFYPASVGSAERPAPTGSFKVEAVAPNPAYYYDPSRLTFTPKGAKGKLKIAPGPNNPVGSTWIALTIPTYGIHGSPDPSLIGKRQSHGCVRLTNWDAVELGKAVQKGVEVDFVGSDPAAASAGSHRKRARRA